MRTSHDFIPIKLTSRYCLSSCGDCGSDQSTAGRAPQPHAAAAAATSAFRAIAAPRWDLYSTMAAHEAMDRRMRTSWTSSVKAYSKRTISADGVVGGMREINIRQLLIDGHTPTRTKCGWIYLAMDELQVLRLLARNTHPIAKKDGSYSC